MSTANSLKCISLKNQEFKVRKVIIDNDYMTFPCAGSCNDVMILILRFFYLALLKILV